VSLLALLLRAKAYRMHPACTIATRRHGIEALSCQGRRALRGGLSPVPGGGLDFGPPHGVRTSGVARAPGQGERL